MNQTLVNWFVIPLLIMLARMTDVTIGTVRIIFVSKGKERIAAALGFFEVIIWLIAISQVMQNLSNAACYLAYGLGFSLGNIIGLLIEKKLAYGMQITRIMTTNPIETLQMVLREEGYGVTTVDAHGAKSAVKVIYVISERKDYNRIREIIHSVEPDSFVTVQDIRSSQAGFIKKRRILPALFKKK